MDLEKIRSDDRSKELHDFLSHNYIANLASTFQDALSLATIFYVFDGKSCFFKSRTQSNHSKNLEHNSEASLTVYFNDSTYSSKYGVQIKGKVNQIVDEEVMSKVVELYAENFEGSASKLPPIKELCSEGIKSTFYQFTISQFKIIDEGFSENRTMGEYDSYELK